MHRALGRGIEAIIPSSGAGRESIVSIDVARVIENKYQSRIYFDEEKLLSLAESIKKQGLMQPIVVSLSGDKYQLIAGERRLRAARLAKIGKIPAIIRKASDEEKFELSLIENLQRENLNPIEEANAYRRLGEEFGLTQEQLAERLGKKRPVIANTLRLLKLPAEIKNLVIGGALSEGHARAVVSLEDRKAQKQLVARILREKLTVREAENIAARLKLTKGKTRRKSTVNTELSEMEDLLRTMLGTKVHVKARGKGGRIDIDYYSAEDLERIVEIIKKGTR